MKKTLLSIALAVTACNQEIPNFDQKNTPSRANTVMTGLTITVTDPSSSNQDVVKDFQASGLVKAGNALNGKLYIPYIDNSPEIGNIRNSDINVKITADQAKKALVSLEEALLIASGIKGKPSIDCQSIVSLGRRLGQEKNNNTNGFALAGLAFKKSPFTTPLPTTSLPMNIRMGKAEEQNAFIYVEQNIEINGSISCGEIKITIENINLNEGWNRLKIKSEINEDKGTVYITRDEAEREHYNGPWSYIDNEKKE